MNEQCKLVIIAGNLSSYLSELNKSTNIDHINRNEQIIYPTNDYPTYVKSVNQIKFMDGFNRKINDVKVFMSEYQKSINSEKLEEWFQMVKHINIKFEV